MSTFRLLDLSLLLLFASSVYCLPVAEDRIVAEHRVRRSQDAPWIADRSPDPPSDILTGRGGKQLPSFESGQEGGASSLAHALGVKPPEAEAKLEQKRDDMYQYDKPRPRPWSYDEYRAVYLAGLAREGGNRKDKQKKSLQQTQPEDSKAKANLVEKRKSEDKYRQPRPPADNRQQSSPHPHEDDYGLSLDDYRRFFANNLNANWPQWSLEDWANFGNRYHEFQASGGQVGYGRYGGGKRKRDDLSDKTVDAMRFDEPGIETRGWDNLDANPEEGQSFRRDSLDNYALSMKDENGEGDYRESHADDQARWEELLSAAFGNKRDISSESQVDRRQPSMPHGESAQDISETAPAPTSSAEARLFEEQRDAHHRTGTSVGEEHAITDQDYDTYHYISLLRHQMLNRKIPGLHSGQRLSPIAGEVQEPTFNQDEMDKAQSEKVSAEFQEQALHGEFSSSQHQRRDSILKYEDSLSDSASVALTRFGAVRQSIRIPGENSNPKSRRDNYWESLSADELRELYSIAVNDPAFLAFERLDTASSLGGKKKQIRSPMPPDVHQTAPVHKGPPPSGANNVTAGKQTSNLDSSSEKDPSPSQTAPQTDSTPHQKRTVAETVDPESQSDGSTEVTKEDFQRPSQPDAKPSYNGPKATTIAEVLAADEAADLAYDASVDTKRDNMYLYDGGLDDWDDCMLSKLFSDTNCDTLDYPRRAREKREEKRDDMGRYEELGTKWDSYGELLKAMEEGRLPSFSSPRSHPRDLSNFPSWDPSSDPHPPADRRGELSNFPSWDPSTDPHPPSDRRGLSNFPSWDPSTDPHPPNDRRDFSPSSIEAKAISGKERRENSDELTVFPSWGPASDPRPPYRLNEAAYIEEQGEDRSPQISARDFIHSEGKGLYSSQDYSISRSKVNQPSGSNTPSLQARNENTSSVEDDRGKFDQDKRDKVDQYDSNMTDEDEWVDIFRWVEVSRQGGQRQGEPDKSKRAPRPDTVFNRHTASEKSSHTFDTIFNGSTGSGQPSHTTLERAQRRAPRPDTVFIRPADSGPSYHTTLKNGSPPTTGLVSMIGNVPGPGTSRHPPSTSQMSPIASSSPDPSAIFFPFGSGLPLGPDAATETPSALLGYGTGKEKRATAPTSSPQSQISTIATMNDPNLSTPTSQTQPQTTTDTLSPAAALNDTLSNIIEELGPLLALASSIPPPPPSSASGTLPAAGTTYNSSTPATPKRDSTANYPAFAHREDWTQEEWDALDDFITFKDIIGWRKSKREAPALTTSTDNNDNDTEALPVAIPIPPAQNNTIAPSQNTTATPTPTQPQSQQQQPESINSAGSYVGPLDCLFFNADPTLDVPAGCFCSGDGTALPTMAGPNPCDYTTLPQTAIPTAMAAVARLREREEKRLSVARAGAKVVARDEEGKYHALYAYDEDSDDEEQGFLDWVLNGPADAPVDKMRRDDVGGLVDGEVRDGVSREEKAEEKEEKTQQVEGEEQGRMEQQGGKRAVRGRRDRAGRWVLGEEEPVKGLLEGSGGSDDAVGFRKRHCGRGLPEGYGDQGNVTDLCGDGGQR